MSKKSALHTIVCFGDSLTEARTEADSDRWPVQFQLSLDKWKPGRFRIYSRGASGETTLHGLDRIESSVYPYLPGTVIVAFGANDCNVRTDRRTARVSLADFERNLREIHYLVTVRGGKCIFVAMYPIDPESRPQKEKKYIQGNGKTYQANYLPYYRAILKTAKALKVPVVDMPAQMKRKGWKTRDLVIEDGLHLTAKGNHHFAAMVFETAKKVLS